MIICAYLGAVHMGEAVFDSQARRFSHIPLHETRPGPESEERNLVTVVECESRLGHFRGEERWKVG